jgi:hypothetical protein
VNRVLIDFPHQTTIRSNQRRPEVQDVIEIGSYLLRDEESSLARKLQQLGLKLTSMQPEAINR